MVEDQGLARVADHAEPGWGSSSEEEEEHTPWEDEEPARVAADHGWSSCEEEEDSPQEERARVASDHDWHSCEEEEDGPQEEWEALADDETREARLAEHQSQGQMPNHRSSLGPDVGSSSNRIWPPSDEEVADLSGIDAGRWRVAFTFHNGRWEEPGRVVHSDLRELLEVPNGQTLRAALLTSFEPTTPRFLRHFPSGAQLVVCISNDRPEKFRNQREQLLLYGVPIQPLSGREDSEAVHCQTTFCSACMPEDMKMNCDTQSRLEECNCSQEERRQVHWVIPKLGGGRSIMHSKLMLLRFDGFLRLVVSSFNLSATQATSAGDSFWWVDVPFHTRICPDPKFGDHLHDHLDRLGVPCEWMQLVRHCKWSSLQQACTKVELITSVPDVHMEETSSGAAYGMKRLNSILSQLRSWFQENEPVIVQVWSLGGAGDSWYQAFANTLTQETLGPIATWSSDPVRFVIQPRHGHFWKLLQAQQNRMRSFLDYILGHEDSQADRAPTQVKKVLWRENDSALLGGRMGYEPLRWGWHSKVMARIRPCGRDTCNKKHGWCYIGSHNCSSSSWGWGARLKPWPRNFEAGVLIVSKAATDDRSECGEDLAPLLPFKPDNLRLRFPAAR